MPLKDSDGARWLHRWEKSDVLEVPSESVRYNMGELCLMSLLGLGQGFVAFLVAPASGWSGNPREAVCPVPVMLL